MCQSPTFNDLATDISQCLRCFCFGVSDVCHSSSVQGYTIRGINSRRLMIVPLEQQLNGSYLDVTSQHTPNQGAIRFDDNTGTHWINSEAAAPNMPEDVYFYWRLPSEFLGNHLMSYGGHLRYTISYERSFSPSPLQIPDVIIRGNGITLYHYEKEFDHVSDDIHVAVRFWAGEWHRDDRAGTSSIPPLFDDTTREDIMIVLQNVNEILIKASYDGNILDSSITDIHLDSAKISNHSDMERSSYIEQCSCPSGYTGPSCERCETGYSRQPLGRYLGRCNVIPTTCQCNDHSNECDPYTGQCLNCADHTEGFNCERCQRGFYHNPDLNPDGKMRCTQCPCGQNMADQIKNLEESDDSDFFPERWLLIPCRYDNLNRDVVCESCPIGYEGRLCDECARGYSRKITEMGSLICELKEKCEIDQFRCGNGTCVPNSVRCNKVNDCLPEGLDEFGCDRTLECNPYGTLTTSLSASNGQCLCKDLVTGVRCDQCKIGSFHLNNYSPSGCIGCFCFGLTNTCTAAFNLYRDHLELKIDQYNHGIVLRDRANNTWIDDLSFDPINREVSYRDFSFNDDLYWQLPFQFLGNKITSYGGFINYTVRFQGNHFPRNGQVPTVILIGGNNISISYQYQGNLNAFVPNTISIPLVENVWTFFNGQPVFRKDMMIILSKLECILLHATVSSDVNLVAISSASLDTTLERSGYDLSSNGYSRVESIEECRCPTGYIGTSCERCAFGYTVSRSEDDDNPFGYSMDNTYLTCIPCSCNGHSNECDPDSGTCINCQHFTTGKYCEQCMTGYDDSTSSGTCTPTKVDHFVTDNYHHPIVYPINQTNDDDRRNMIDGHECKPNLQGERCDRCRDGYFHFDPHNPYGCLQCYCSGVTDQCSSSENVYSPIHFNLSTIYPPQNHEFELTNRFRTHYYTDQILVNIYHNELYFYSLFWLHNNNDNNINFNQNQNVEQPKLEMLYWTLPPQFLGNRLTSYGGSLRYKQRYMTQAEGGEYISDVDVILSGNGISLQYINSGRFNENEERLFVIPINAEDGSWQMIDRQRQISGLASRVDFLRVLSNLESISIRATLHTEMKESNIKDVTLDEAVHRGYGHDRALSVEQCQCPSGYTGLSCEQCETGYIRNINPATGTFKCVQCQCHSHSDECDKSLGKCLNCQHFTIGDNCEQCMPGYYGDATRGTGNDCLPCPCPSTDPMNNFSPTCIVDLDGSATCTECHGNYTGRYCEQCSHGYHGSPTTPGGRCELINKSMSRSIQVRIEGPNVRHVPMGSTVNIKCTGISQVNKFAFNLDWIKLDGPLPYGSSEASGVLTLSNVRDEHSGTYVCTGSDLESVAQAQITILVQPGQHQQSRPKVRIEPHFQNVTLGEPATFKCIADGYPPPQLHWTMGQNQIQNPMASFTPETGIFFIPATTLTDEAEYYCHATNSAGSDSVRAVLFIRPSEYHHLEYVHVGGNGIIPTARVSPGNHVAVKGENVRLECNVTGQPVPSVRWTFTGGGPNGQLPFNSRPIGGVLQLSKVDTANGGVYTCIASNSFGTAEAQVRLKVILQHNSPPTVNVEPIRQTIVQGQTGELRCVATGSPKPTITWQKIGDQLNHMRHKLTEDRLIIERMEVNDRGLYVCRAENIEGSSQGSAVVEIELREIPSIEISRHSSQIVPRGSSAYFQCRITGGIPEPSIEWRRSDGSPFTSKVDIVGGLLQFKDISAPDEGIYICTAENIAGRVTAQANLRIAGAPRIKILQNTPYRIRPGEHVRLECNLISFDSYSEKRASLNWHRLKVNQYENRTQYALPMHPVNIYQDRAILEFRSIKTSDSGIYVCTASSAIGNSEERIQVIVEEASNKIVPDVYIEDKVVTVAAGSRAELRCFVRGTDRNVLIKWARADNRSMPDMSRVENGTLTVDQVKPDDSGDYHCLGYVDSTGGQGPPRLLFRDRARLAVVGIWARAPPKIQIYPPLQTVRPGDTVYIDCEAYDNSHSVTIDWSRIGSELPTGVSTEVAGARLVIRGVQETDAGRYLCTAVNAAGKVEAVGEIIVDRRTEPIDTVKEEVTIVGSNLDLICPAPLVDQGANLNVEWKYESSDQLPLNGQVINNEFRIVGAVPENSGRYICTASLAGSIVDQSSIVVKVKANTTLDVKVIPSRETIYLSDHLSLNCSTIGDPMAQIEWSMPYQNGPWLDNVNVKDAILNVSHVSYQNGGVYRCMVRTYAGTYNADYVLVIQETTTTPLPDPVETHLIPFGSSITLPCGVSVLSPIQFTWTRSSSANPLEQSLPSYVEMYPNGTIHIGSTIASDAGTYTCTAVGIDRTDSLSRIIIVEGIIPRFIQKPLSYMSLPTLPNAYQAFNITISVKPEKPDGLILYNGQDQANDFISLGLNNGYVEFRFELGGGVAIIRSEREIELNRWHTIMVTRERNIGKMKIDDEDIVSSSAKTSHVGLDLLQPLYFGGVPNFSLISVHNGFKQGFVGCIAQFKVGNRQYELIKEAIVKHDVSRCDTCSHGPCLNSGTCRESVFRTQGYECVCPIGFGGIDCEESGGTCYPSACNAGICVEGKSKRSFDCHCPFGSSGSRCEREILIHEPFLTDGAYLAYPPPRHALNRLIIKLKIKPKFIDLSSSNGHLLFYTGQYNNGSGDFAALTIVNRSIEFRFDTGSGAAIISSPFPLEDEQWIDIYVERYRQEANLTVGPMNGTPIYGKTPGRTHGLTLLTPIYVGGYNRTRIHMPSSLEKLINYDGCIGYLEINGKEVPILNSYIESVNVQDCQSESRCQRKPCINGGSCIDVADGYECICNGNFAGKNCELKKGPCDTMEINPCSNLGECENEDDNENFQCHCPIGFGGPKCVDTISMLNPHSARMNGNSFLSFDSSYLTQSNLEFELIKFKMKTNHNSDGLLFFYGPAIDSERNVPDFMAVALNQSHLEMTFDLGAGIGHIRTEVSVVDDRVHDVFVKLSGRTGTIMVDGISFSDTSPGSLTSLNSVGDIYFGGVPHYSSMTGARYNAGYVGCIWDIEIGISGVLDLISSTKRSRNIMPCEDESSQVEVSTSAMIEDDEDGDDIVDDDLDEQRE